MPPERVGSVTGVVGAAGGLGGFVPPLVMGAVCGATDDYTWGYVLLAVTAGVTAVFTATTVRPVLGAGVGFGHAVTSPGRGGPVAPCHRPGAPQSGNQRVRSCSMCRSSLSTALTWSSRGLSRLFPGSGANG